MPDELNQAGKQTPDDIDLKFGEEINVEESGFSFQPILGFELEIDGSVYMYSEDGNLEISLTGGELEEGVSIADLNHDLASEFMDNFDDYELFDAGSEMLHGTASLLNDIQFFNAEEQGLGRALICTPHTHQYFFILMIASSEYWHRHGEEIFNALKSHIHFHPQFPVEAEDPEPVDHPDLTIETYQEVPSGEPFLLRIEKGDVSLLLAARSRTPEEQVTLLDIFTPDGNQFYHYDAPSGELTSQISDKPLVGKDGELEIFFPRNNQQALQTGEYQFLFGTESGTPLQEIQVIIRAGRALDIQTIDLNFYLALANGHFFDASYLAEFEANVRTALNQRFSPLNLSVGEIECFHPAPDELTAFSTININTDLADCSYMISETVNNARALNIGLVDQLVEGDPPVTADIQAVSSGCPGMILAPASPHTCILIDWSVLEEDLSRLADALIEQLIVFSGIETQDALPEGERFSLNHEIAWRLRRHPIFYDLR